MATVTVQEKIKILEAELQLVKGVIRTRPDIRIDEKNWNAVKQTARSVRKALFAERYGTPPHHLS